MRKDIIPTRYKTYYKAAIINMVQQWGRDGKNGTNQIT